jgi:D-3-phosphoglycerate dehydrogenase / 2-oxoglutarate reductase
MMKAVAVGDLFIPREKMAELFRVEGVREAVTESTLLEFEGIDRNDIRRKIRNIEAHGPAAEAPPSGLAAAIEEAAILAVHLCPVSAAIIEKARSLKVVCTARGSVDNLDVAALSRRRIPVITTPHHNTNAVAEYVIGLMIAETRNIARSHLALRGATWRERYNNSSFIPELRGSLVGILGYGQVGRLVAQKLASLGARIAVCDPLVPEADVRAAGYGYVDRETLFRECDILSLHVRLTRETRGMVGARELRMMKPSSYLVNTARAALVDSAALAHALREKWISGAAVDVFEEEPVPPDHPLLGLDNVTITNHRAGDTRDAYWMAPVLMGEQLALYLRGQKPQFMANPEVL